MSPTQPMRQSGPEYVQELPDLRALFHQLNNQLGIILAHAELLEVKATDEASRLRAAQVVTSVLDAIATAQQIRRRSEPAGV